MPIGADKRSCQHFGWNLGYYTDKKLESMNPRKFEVINQKWVGSFLSNYKQLEMTEE